jgi:hypothetical protein
MENLIHPIFKNGTDFIPRTYGKESNSKQIKDMFDKISRINKSTRIGMCSKCGSNSWRNNECNYCGYKINY